LAKIDAPMAVPVDEKADALARQLRVHFQRLGDDRRIRRLVEDRLGFSSQASAASNCTRICRFSLVIGQIGVDYEGDDLLFDVNFRGPMVGTVFQS